MNTERTTSRKVRVGKVVSDKMDKTVVVIVEDRVAHKTYKKIIGRTYRLKAHDENNVCGVGDIVRVMETRPLSKDTAPRNSSASACWAAPSASTPASAT